MLDDSAAKMEIFSIECLHVAQFLVSVLVGALWTLRDGALTEGVTKFKIMIFSKINICIVCTVEI